ncbi:hypothetical protein VTI28DRAFT_8820 [Corynascus sepedonium]
MYCNLCSPWHLSQLCLAPLHSTRPRTREVSLTASVGHFQATAPLRWPCSWPRPFLASGPNFSGRHGVAVQSAASTTLNHQTCHAPADPSIVRNANSSAPSPIKCRHPSSFVSFQQTEGAQVTVPQINLWGSRHLFICDPEIFADSGQTKSEMVREHRFVLVDSTRDMRGGCFARIKVYTSGLVKLPITPNRQDLADAIRLGHSSNAM